MTLPKVFGCLALSLGMLAANACNLNTRPGTGSGDNSAVQDCGGNPSAAGCPDAGQTGAAGPTGSGDKAGETAVGSPAHAGDGATTDAGVIDAGPMLPKHADGESCGANSECMSAHCSAGVCCAGGDCCRMPSDCPKTVVAGMQLVCNDTTTCQGSGGAISCTNFRCAAIGGEPNDSACTVNHLSKTCGAYKAVYCNGANDQKEPACPTSCTQDADCTTDAHCTAGKVCVKFVVDGGACMSDADCTSGHCGGGICCGAGTCCRDAQDCAGFDEPAVCLDETQCKGSRTEGVCSDNQCRSVEMPDSAGCMGRKAADCGSYLDVSCGTGMTAPKCPTECRSSSECKPTAYCTASSLARPGKCIPKQRDGATCTASVQCQSKCDMRNGVCCSSTDAMCCSASDQCSTLDSKGCVDATSCAGQTIRGVCESGHCSALKTADSTVCQQQVDCPPEYRRPRQCPGLDRCICESVQDCSDNFVCSASRACVRPTAVGGSGGAGGAGGTVGSGGMSGPGGP